MQPVHTLADLTISNGTKNSGIIERKSFAHMGALAFCGPTGLTETVNVQYAPVEKKVADYVDADFFVVQEPAGTDVAIAAEKCVPIGRLTAHAIRLRSTTNVGGDRTFKVCGREQALGLK